MDTCLPATLGLCMPMHMAPESFLQIPYTNHTTTRQTGQGMECVFLTGLTLVRVDTVSIAICRHSASSSPHLPHPCLPASHLMGQAALALFLAPSKREAGHWKTLGSTSNWKSRGPFGKRYSKKIGRGIMPNLVVSHRPCPVETTGTNKEPSDGSQR
jgi:hypothetical protein